MSTPPDDPRLGRKEKAIVGLLILASVATTYGLGYWLGSAIFKVLQS